MPTTTCEHDEATLTRAALQMLSEAERMALDDRLATCGTCRARLAEYRTLVSDLRQLVPAAAAASTRDRALSRPAARRSGRAAQWRERNGATVGGAGEDGADGEDDAVTAPRPLAPARWRSRARSARALVSTLAAVLLLALLLGGFWSFGSGRGRHGSPGRAASTSAVVVPGVASALGPAPVACAGAPQPLATAGAIGGAVGQAPFWVGGFVGTHATLLAGGTPAPHGYYGKIVTQLDTGYDGTVTLRGTNLADTTPLWFDLGGKTATTFTTSRTAGANDAGYIFIPASGCYTLTATWGTQRWSYTFAAGSALPTTVGALPATCPNQSAPASLGANLPAVIGQRPLWLTADGPRASYRVDLSGDGVPLSFYVSNTFTHAVTLQGRNIATGSPIGFVASPNPPATVLSLNNSYARAAGPYTEWPARAYFPTAGCYELTATWPGGSWTLDVAAGA